MGNSKQIELTILPANTTWLAGQIAGIRALLDSGENQEKKLQAARNLGYMDTSEAVAEIARRYAQPATDSQPPRC
jgi:hypothetical protein